MKFLYILLLLGSVVFAGCSHKYNQTFTKDASCYTYFYNPDNTLHYALRHHYCDTENNYGYISAFNYSFDTSLQQASIIVSYYEKCDAPNHFKIKYIYNTKGQLLNESVWLLHYIPDTTCSPNYLGLAGYSLYDTSSNNQHQTLREHLSFEYSKRGGLKKVIAVNYETELIGPQNSIRSEKYLIENTPDTLSPKAYTEKYAMINRSRFSEFISGNDARNLTIIPYLKSLGKLK